LCYGLSLIKASLNLLLIKANGKWHAQQMGTAVHNNHAGV